MKPISRDRARLKTSLKTVIAIASMALFLSSCNSSQSDPSATATVDKNASDTQTRPSQTSQSQTRPSTPIDPETPEANSLTGTPQPSELTNPEESLAETPIENITPEETLTEEIEIIELPDFPEETAQTPEETEVEEPQPEATEDSRPTVEVDLDSSPEKSSIDIGEFDFQLRQVSLEKEILDRVSNKRLSTENADEPSSYLFIELDLKNNSEEIIWDSVLYTLECGDGNIIENAADVARVYRSNRNIKISSEIPPGGKGLVADAFLVPEYCLKSGDLNLIVSPVGKGKAVIPLNLE